MTALVTSTNNRSVHNTIKPLSIACAFVALSACSDVKRPDGGTGLLPAGAMIPDLSGVDQSGQSVQLRGYMGQPLVVYFYPADDTPGCTKEACAFRDTWSKYQEAKVNLVGVSTDTGKSHKDFAKKYSLPFALVDDTSRAWVRAFGVPTTLGYASRVTFLIDSTGKVAQVYKDVDPGVHANQVLEAAKQLARPLERGVTGQVLSNRKASATMLG